MVRPLYTHTIWMVFSCIVTCDFIFIVMQEWSVFSVLWNVERPYEYLWKGNHLLSQKYRAICICMEPIKINATDKFHSTWFYMIGFLRYIVSSIYHQWQNCWDLNGVTLKNKLVSLWNDVWRRSRVIPYWWLVTTHVDLIWEVLLIPSRLKQISLMVWPILFWKSYIYNTCTDLGSEMLSVWNFCAHSTWRHHFVENQW